MYTDVEDIHAEYDELRDKLYDRQQELLAIHMGSDGAVETPAEFNEFEMLNAWHEDEIVYAENKVNPNTQQWYTWLDIVRINQILYFCNEAGIDPDSVYWDDIGPMIPKDEFVQYAEDFAYEVGAINDRNNDWPLYCIDWDRAAEDLSMDYNLVMWEGQEYYVRYI